MKKRMVLTALCLAMSAAITQAAEPRIVFYLPFEGDLVARTPEREVEPTAGVVLLEDFSQSVTIGELAAGKQVRLGGEEISAEGDNRVAFVPGISGGRGVRLQTMLTYPTAWMKTQPRGTIALWYRNPRWRVLTWRVPAMLTTAQTYRAKTSAFQTPISWWIFDRLTAPPEQGTSRWFNWYLDFFTEHPRNISPREMDDDKWHFWALRWDRDAKLIEVIDDDVVRDIGKYANMLEPGKDHWIEEYRGHKTEVYEDTGHIKFEEIFLGEIHLARYCHVSLDEIAVWDTALDHAALSQACARVSAGEPAWPSAALPLPKRGANETLDMGSLPPERPPLPAAVQWDIAGSHIEENDLQTSTCLNGYWRLQPVAERLTPPSPAEWLYVRLPGLWSAKAGTVRDAAFKEWTNKREGKNYAWETSWHDKPIEEYAAFWLEREVTVPADHSGRRFFLRFDRYDPDKTIFDAYINGQYAGRVSSYGPGHIDVTKWIKPGKSNRLALMRMGAPQFLFDLYLDARTCTSVSVHDPYVIPDYRGKSVAVRFDLENNTDKPQTYSYGAEFTTWKGEEPAQRITPTPITLQPGEKRKAELRGAWPEPHCWSIYDPFLYQCRVLVGKEGETVDESLPVRFGFRELWVEDGWLMCNGSRVHVRGLGQPYGILGYTQPVDDAAMQQRSCWYFATQKKVGQFWKRGVNKYNAGAFLDTADEMGGIATIRIDGTGFTAARLWAGNPAEQAQALGLMKWVRNHPSLASFIVRQSPDQYELGAYERQGRSAGGNVLMSSFFWWNEFDEKAIWDLYRRHWDSFVRPYQQSYPTFSFMGMWAPYGDFMGCKIGKYGHGVGLQSREELAQKVSGGRIIPLNAECGWPQITRNAMDVSGIDDLATHYAQYWPNLNQLYDETAATFIGDEAYDQDALSTNGLSKSYKKKDDGTARFDWDYVKGIETVGRPFSRKAVLHESPAFVKFRKLSPRRVIAAWRWFGLGYWEHTESSTYFKSFPDSKQIKSVVFDATRQPGLYLGNTAKREKFEDVDAIADATALTGVGEEVTKAQGPVVAWIQGWPEPLRKDHAYFSGERVRKQIGVMSEYPWPVDLTVKWRVRDMDRNEILADGTIDVSFKTGDRSRHPLDFIAPTAESKRRFRLEIETSMDDRVVHDDSFAFQVFPHANLSGISGSIAVVDTKRTQHLLSAAGISYTPVTEKTDLSRFQLLVIGSLTDQNRTRPLLAKLDIKKHMANGLNVLIFTQEPYVLDRPNPDPWPKMTLKPRPDRPELVSYGLKVERRSARYLFIRDPEHPIFKGLSNEDFANWRGASHLISPWAPEGWYASIGPSRNWRDPNMSNMGDMATYLAEKPHGGNFVSLLDGDFDLLYSALLEERRAGGKTIVCTLNLSERYRADPVATLVANRLLRYALEPVKGPQGKAAFMGNDSWRQAVEALPFDLPNARSLRDIDLLMVGMGTPHVDEFDKENSFIGTTATPADDKDKTLRWLRKNKAEVADFVNSGGAVLVLPVSAEEELDWLPVKIALQTEKVFALKPGTFFNAGATVSPSDLYWRRAIEIPLPSELPPGSRTTTPAALSRVPYGKGEFIFCQVHPDRFYGNWAKSKINRVISTVLTDRGIADNLDIDLTTEGYGKNGFPYTGCTLYFDPYLSTSW